MKIVLELQNFVFSQIQKNDQVMSRMRNVYLLKAPNNAFKPYILVGRFSRHTNNSTSCIYDIFKFSLQIYGQIQQVDNCNIVFEELEKLLCGVWSIQGWQVNIQAGDMSFDCVNDCICQGLFNLSVCYV